MSRKLIACIGLLAMTFVTGLQPGYAEDHTGRRPNPAFRDAYLRQKERKTPLPPPQAPLRFAPEERWFGKESYLVDVLGQLILRAGLVCGVLAAAGVTLFFVGHPREETVQIAVGPRSASLSWHF